MDLAINTTTDVCYVLLPVYIFWTLQITSKRKYTLMALQASSARLAFLDEFLAANFSWKMIPVFVADVIERNLAELPDYSYDLVTNLMSVHLLSLNGSITERDFSSRIGEEIGIMATHNMGVI
ncbi:hypothetical protein F4780DRAFT_774741 [Xylariomycetidae sp. FL0641]|nr:hypothetical protein F4780DRAFT_774741 [Xylariomycetidae sp. FL0641]